jgi:hypothetical protein
VKQLGPDYADYWGQFEAMYEAAVQAAVQGPDHLARFRVGLIYYPDILVAAATAGYEVEVSPAEAVGLMVVLEAYAFTAKHGTISRLLRPSLRNRARDHDNMLKVVSPTIIHLLQKPIANEFTGRVSHHLKGLARHS